MLKLPLPILSVIRKDDSFIIYFVERFVRLSHGRLWCTESMTVCSSSDSLIILVESRLFLVFKKVSTNFLKDY